MAHLLPITFSPLTHNQHHSTGSDAKKKDSVNSQQDNTPVVQQGENIDAAIRQIVKAASEVGPLESICGSAPSLYVLDGSIHHTHFPSSVPCRIWVRAMVRAQQFVEQEVSCSDQHEGIDVVIRCVQYEPYNARLLPSPPSAPLSP
jgi:hypothetical protein